MGAMLTGDQKDSLRCKLFEIERQIRQSNGYPFDQKDLDKFLQRAVEGRFQESTQNWREQDGVIYISVTSDGTTGESWINRLESKGFRLGDYAKSMLRSDDFNPTAGVTTEVAVLKGSLFSDSNRVTKNIRADAKKRAWSVPNAEVACS